MPVRHHPSVPCGPYRERPVGCLIPHRQFRTARGVFRSTKPSEMRLRRSARATRGGCAKGSRNRVSQRHALIRMGPLGADYPEFASTSATFAASSGPRTPSPRANRPSRAGQGAYSRADDEKRIMGAAARKSFDGQEFGNGNRGRSDSTLGRRAPAKSKTQT